MPYPLLGTPDSFSHRRHTQFAIDDAQVKDIPIHNPQRLTHSRRNHNAAFFTRACPRPQFCRFGEFRAFQDLHVFHPLYA
jgi:hypothetical protein